MKIINLVISKDTEGNVTIDNPSVIFSQYDLAQLSITLSGFDTETGVKVSATLENSGTSVEGTEYSMSPDSYENSKYNINVSDLIDTYLSSGETYIIYFNFTVYNDAVTVGTITSNGFGMYKTNLEGVSTDDVEHLYIELNKLISRVNDLEEEE